MQMVLRQFFTVAELAEMQVAGLPKSQREINKRARKECWDVKADDYGHPLARRRCGKGGGYEYHISVLPAAARADLARRSISPEPGSFAHVDANADHSAEAANIWQWFARQSAEVRAEAQRRAEILQQVDAFVAAGMTRSAAVYAVANEGASSATIWTWLRLVKGIAASERLPNLAPQRKGGGKEQELDADIWQALLSDYLRLSQPSWTTCYRRTAMPMAQAKGVELPHYRTLWRKFDRDVPKQVVTLRRKGDEALRRMLPAQIRSVADLHAMEIVNIDGHRCDVFVRMPDGRIVRLTMIAIQDVYSRKFLSWRYAESEDMVTARMVFADLFAKWGIPKGLLADNGRAFASKWLTGGAKTRFRFKIRDEDPTGLLVALGINIHWAKPYRGQSKPIERGFRDLCDAIAKHPAFEGAYTGNNPMAKPENYGNAAVDLEVFMRVWDAGMEAHNRQAGRRSEMAGGKLSFDQVFDASYARMPIGKASDEQMRMALLAADQVNADRQNGAITLAGNRYWCPELCDVAGQKVTVRFDPEKLHDPIHVYDRQGKFITSVPLWEATGFLDMASAKKRQKLERNWRKSSKAAAAALDLLSADALVSKLPDYEGDDEKPTPTVIRAVRHRGNTAAALKPSQDAIETAQRTAETTPAGEASIDVLTRAMERRLRLVE